LKTFLHKTLRQILLILFFTSSLVFSQGIGGGGAGGGGSRIKGDFKFMPIPYFNYNRSIGVTLGALPMAMFNPVKSDTISPSSLAGLLAMYSTNKTWFAMGFAKMYFDEDNWRLTFAGGVGSVNFQFYLDNPIDVWVPYNTGIDFATLEVQRRIYDKLYFGLSYIYLKFVTTIDSIQESSTDVFNGIGLNLNLDQRTNVYYPKNGLYAEMKFHSYPEAFGNESPSNKIEFSFNQYFPFRNDLDVLVWRLFVGLGLGDLTFNQQFIVGEKDIRGYTQGEYRGNYKVDIQGEYRWNFANRWGMVGFVGLATVYESLNEDDDGKLLPGIGTGIRFTAFEDNHMNVGLDIAVGDNDWGMYFRIGEAF
jgi:outer membrane protein assembly factor BamA